MPDDPSLTYVFSVQVATGTNLKFSGYFSEITGFDLTIATVEYKTFNGTTGVPETQIIPGRVNSGTVTLKRGFSNDLSFWDWCQAVLNGRMHDARATVTVVTYDRDYAPRHSWTLFNAWPSKFSLDSLTSADSNFRMESLTLVYETMEFVKVEAPAT